ncbi:LytR/AlgR family response regulator transcription factor [Aquimarina litoralis]|uniref:LytR/AlgR family response regulator transcription factor n=1 Tax=Aquimarina litoralis TaxID=584605 RepID=UPI001C56E9F8|nr:LytTR family DNA-binding domain-containing protein [Aquimarina litoralis]MBW1298854.1 response regulator [Aquimarina litoralis]
MISDIPVILIEDDIEARRHLSSLLEQHFSSIKIIAFSDNIKDAISLINQHEPEIVFMDIKLLDGTAFEILDAIYNPNFEVIFVTAHADFLEQAISYYAFNFITKPIDEERLKNVINRYIQLKDRFFTKKKYELFKEFLSDSKLLVNTGNEHISLEIAKIVRCEADGNYTFFMMDTKEKHMVSKSLKYYETLLSKKGFFRANRSTLINIKHISSIYKKESIILTDQEKVIVSTRNKSKLSDLIKHLT